MYCLDCKQILTVWRHFLVDLGANKGNVNEFLIAVTILLTKLFRMTLRGNLAGLKSNAPAHWFSKIVLPSSILISSASKAR